MKQWRIGCGKKGICDRLLARGPKSVSTVVFYGHREICEKAAQSDAKQNRENP